MKTKTKIAAVFGGVALTTLLIIIIASAVQSAGDYETQFPDDSLVYAAEITRHGARAPLLGADDFPVDTEQLTPMGMRQRYLLGRYYYETYFKQFMTADKKSDPPVNFYDNLWIASTDVNRTIQSAASQYLGFTQELRANVTPTMRPEQ